MRGGSVLAAALVLAGVVAACDVSTGTGTPPGKIVVVTTTSVFADMVANVGGDLVEVRSLVPMNGDVHTFEPRPADIRAVAGARLLVMNGLGLDDWLEKTFTNAAAAGTPLLRLAPGLPGVELLPGDEPGTQNPHVFLDVAGAKGYVARIRDALTSVDPAHASEYERGATAYLRRLDALDATIRAKVGAIPAAARRIATFHDAFPYYARAYGIDIVGVAVRAPGQDPSAGETARLIAAIRDAGVKAIFSERQFPTHLVDQLATETGAKVVSDLYSDSLGDPPVTSDEALMEWDTDRLAEALR